MSCARGWPARFNKTEIKLNVREIEWKSLMNECLMEADILNKRDNESEKYSCVNPNSAMDFRHQMARKSTKVFYTPPIQIQTEALKLLRMKNYSRMLKQKEGKMVEKEIVRLKETLENNRLLIHEKLNEATKKRAKCSQNTPKLVKYYAKQCKRLELLDGICEVDTWLGRSVQMKMETKINQQGIPVDVKVSLKRLDQAEEPVEPAPTPIIMDEAVRVQRISETSENKNEIKFCQKNTEFLSKELNDLKRGERMKEMLEIRKRVNLRIIRNSWMTWKIFTQQHKSRKKEKRIFKNKIESFLSNLQDRETREEMRKTNGKTNRRSGSVSNPTEKQVINEKKEKFLKLMKEVKISQAETYEKLREMSKVNLRNREKPPNLDFVNRLEERREERLKRRKEIEERKLKSMEDRKNAEKLKEEEKRLKEEENERKRLEESREKRRLQAEKRKAQEREREKLRLNTKLAENHRKNHLLRSYGLRPWLKLMRIRDEQEDQALAFCRQNLLRKVFNALASNAREETRLKTIRADEFRERILKKNFLLLWMDFHQENVKREQVAADWNEFKITERAFRKWLRFTQNEQLEYLNKKAVAVLNYERMLKTKYLKKMRDYPVVKKLEQAKENRKRKWRQRVKEILPDYQPAETCFV